MNPTAFVTGISGQDGSYLAESLLAKGYTVHGIVRHSSTATRSWLESEHLDRPHLHYGGLIEQAQPDEVYHLAAQSQRGSRSSSPSTPGVGRCA